MIHELQFSREIIVDINAAVVGISRNRWVTMSFGNASEPKAQQIMKQHGFDVLPIIDRDVVREYFITKSWNDYSRVVRQDITHRDVIPFLTHIPDVVRAFATEKRRFYFLSAENQIVGLISVTNLNSRQVQIFIFSLFCELETLLAKFLSAKISEENLKILLKAKRSPKRYNEIIKRFERDKSQGTDAEFVEYLYLSDLLQLMSEGYWEELKISQEVLNELQGINEWRNRVAHPTRSLIRDPTDVEQLWNTLDRIEEVLFQLRVLLRSI
jgi:CBS domain-containing protein